MKFLALFLVALLGLVSSQECPDPFQLVGEKCYSFSDQPMSNLFSEAQCEMLAPEGQKSALAVIENCHQLGLLWRYISQVLTRPANYWIGGNDKSEEGVWLWSTGDAVAPLWLPGQPDGGADENYLSLSEKGYFADESQTVEQYYVCQLMGEESDRLNGSTNPDF